MESPFVIPKEQQREQEHEITSLRAKEEEEFAKKLAEDLNLPYINLSFVPIQQEAVQIIPKDEAREAEIAIIQKTGRVIQIVARDPRNKNAKNIIDSLKNQYIRVTIFVVSETSLKKAWGQYPKSTGKTKITGEVSISPNAVKSLRESIHSWDDLRQNLSTLSEERVSSVLEMILAGALNLRASDVHIETQDKDRSVLRLRIDGILHNITEISPHAQRLLLSRVKLLSGMKLNIKNTSQDGRFSLASGEDQIEIRSSALPGEYGENIVLRVLDPASLKSVADLGFRQNLFELIDSQIHQPNGMILVTGPTGSGKTTTLYAFLKTLATPEVKIITLEDPVEYHLEGITQTQVDPKHNYTFASGLRSILRQDPDIILVGEIRDDETADTAIHASLTGHLVFSTLHTNDAAGAIPRLMSLGGDPAVLGSALHMIIAQRLVRVLCAACKKSYTPTKEEMAYIQDVINSLPIQFPKPVFSVTDSLYIPVGCEECTATGYRGRIGVFEILPMTPELEQLIQKHPTIAQIKDLAYSIGVTTMEQDGVLNVIAGNTTIEEVKRVMGEE
ncbi:MAG: type II/IV secretion system protein [Candidatus Spechtbacteria bacterium]|nr:type II/IV secretion system protein [Candidatus Spechtbacteria bacterium]